MSYPKDLLEAIEETTGGNYYNNYANDTKELTDIYREASEDLLNLVISIKREINEVLKDTNKYKINKDTELLLRDVMDYRNKDTIHASLTPQEKEKLKGLIDPKKNELLYYKLFGNEERDLWKN